MSLQIIRNDITKMRVDAIVNGCQHFSFGRRWCGRLHSSCRRTGTACRMQYAAWLRDWQRKNHKGISPALQICDSCSRPALARWQASGTTASGILLSDIFEPGKRKWLSGGGFSADFLRHLRLSKRPGSEGCSRYQSVHSCWKMRLMVYIVIFDKKAYQISGKLFADIAAYIDDWYVDEHTDSRVEQRRRLEALSEESCFEAASAPLPSEAICKSCSSQSLEEALGQIDESFSEMLLRKIDESGMTDVQCYKKANIDRKLFSKIRSDKFYKHPNQQCWHLLSLWSCRLPRCRRCSARQDLPFPIRANSISL